MPLFFFDIGDDGTWVRDAYGISLEHRMDAPREAVAVITEMLVDGPIDGCGRSIECQVRDEDGRVIYGASVDLRGMWGRGNRLPSGRSDTAPRSDQH